MIPLYYFMLQFVSPEIALEVLGIKGPRFFGNPLVFEDIAEPQPLSSDSSDSSACLVTYDNVSDPILIHHDIDVPTDHASNGKNITDFNNNGK